MNKITPQNLAAIAATIGAENSSALPPVTLTGLADLTNAGPQQLSYCQATFASQLADTKAGAVITTSALAPLAPCPVLVVTNPRLAWAKVTNLFVSQDLVAGVHPSAQVDESVQLGEGVSISAGAVIEAGAILGDRVSIGSNTWIGESVTIGARSRIAAQVCCYQGVQIGCDCLIHGGAVLGSDGFGFERDDSGKWHKIAQIGGVSIGDEVEIGANSTVDGGALLPTRIGNGVKIDNLTQLGHGCTIGENCLLCGGVLVSGSVKMGDGCILAGNNAIKYGISLAPGTIVAGSTSLTKSTTKAGEYLALFPAKKQRDWLQFLRSLERHARR